MFGAKSKKTPAQMGAEVAEGVSQRVSEFYEIRVAPLQGAIADVFAESLDRAIEAYGLDAKSIRKEFADMEVAWANGLLEMKSEILEFRDLQDWLECAEAVGARGEILDWVDHQFDGFTKQLRELALEVVGGRVLRFGLESE